MGNWTTVNIKGTCDADELPALRDAVSLDYSDEDWHCLTGGGGICGLPVWAFERIDVTGNLAERDYGHQDIADTLEWIMKKAPSLDVKVHVGGDYESLDCVATITAKDGKASIGDPEVERLEDIDQGQMQANFLAQLMKPRV